MRHLGRSGFTVVELLIATLLGTVLMAAVMKVFMSEHAVYDARGAHIEGRQIVRVGLEVMANELREISPADGDIVAMAGRSMTVRSSTSLAFVCDVVTGLNPGVKMRVTGGWLSSGDSVMVFAEINPQTANDNVWLMALPVASDTTESCGADAAQFLELPGLSDALDADSVLVGAPVRGFRHRTYAMGSVGGRPFLVRSGPQESATPLVGPLRDSVGVEFQFLDITETPTVQADQIAFVTVTLRTEPGVEEVTRQPVLDQLTVLVAPRN